MAPSQNSKFPTPPTTDLDEATFRTDEFENCVSRQEHLIKINKKLVQDTSAFAASFQVSTANNERTGGEKSHRSMKTARLPAVRDVTSCVKRKKRSVITEGEDYKQILFARREEAFVCG